MCIVIIYIYILAYCVALLCSSNILLSEMLFVFTLSAKFTSWNWPGVYFLDLLFYFVLDIAICHVSLFDMDMSWNHIRCNDASHPMLHFKVVYIPYVYIFYCYECSKRFVGREISFSDICRIFSISIKLCSQFHAGLWLLFISYEFWDSADS